MVLPTPDSGASSTQPRLEIDFRSGGCEPADVLGEHWRTELWFNRCKAGRDIFVGLINSLSTLPPRHS
jgi:hypothetical protein